MRGYKTGLEKFIEYIFDNYGSDENIKPFKELYFEKQKELEQKRAIKRSAAASTVRITSKTAEICGNLIKLEFMKDQQLKCLSESYKKDLAAALIEVGAISYENKKFLGEEVVK